MGLARKHNIYLLVLNMLQLLTMRLLFTGKLFFEIPPCPLACNETRSVHNAGWWPETMTESHAQQQLTLSHRLGWLSLEGAKAWKRLWLHPHGHCMFGASGTNMSWSVCVCFFLTVAHIATHGSQKHYPSWSSDFPTSWIYTTVHCGLRSCTSWT